MVVKSASKAVNDVPHLELQTLAKVLLEIEGGSNLLSDFCAVF